MQEQQRAVLRTSIDAIELWAMRPTELVALADAPRADGAEARGSWAFMIEQEPPRTEEDEPPYEIVDGVAVIPVEGVVMRQDEGLFWSTAGLKEIEAAVGQALEDPAARAVLFQVYSPGGVAGGVKELGDVISAARAVKPMAAWIDGMGCSAAYWIASATGRVYAGPSATVGSIGVLRRHVSYQALNKDWGIAVSYVTAGAYKALGNSDQNLSDLARKTFQDRVDQIYDMFTADVAQRMGLALEQRDAWANGRDFLASEAASLGLVSQIVGTRDEAISTLLSETRMDTTELTTQYPEQVASLQAEAVKAAMQGQEEALASARTNAVEGVLALAAVVCDEATAQRLRDVVASGMTPEQLLAAKNIFAAAPAAEAPKAAKAAPSADAREQILGALKAATPGAVADGAKAVSEEDALIARIGNR